MSATRVGIPTFYKDVRFRSRLEARWAAFFDRAHWPWAYEPLELDGWIPDFAILKDYELVMHPLVQTAKGAGADPYAMKETHDQISGIVPNDWLVEVKPELTWPGLSIYRGKIDRAKGSTGKHVLLVGAAVPIGAPTLGIGQLRFGNQWHPAQVGWCTQACGNRLTVLSPTKTCLFCSMDLLGKTDRTRASSIAHDLWIAAGNDTQWNHANG